MIKMKPLTWKQMDTPDGFIAYETFTPLGRYKVQMNTNTGRVFWVGDRGGTQPIASIEHGKIAAEKAYRLKAAIEIIPHIDVDEAVLINTLVRSLYDMTTKAAMCCSGYDRGSDVDEEMSELGGLIPDALSALKEAEEAGYAS